MEKKVTVTEDLFIDCAEQAIDNLNKIEKLTPMLHIFASIVSVEIKRVLFDETPDTNIKEFTIKE